MKTTTNHPKMETPQQTDSHMDQPPGNLYDVLDDVQKERGTQKRILRSRDRMATKPVHEEYASLAAFLRYLRYVLAIISIATGFMTLHSWLSPVMPEVMSYALSTTLLLIIEYWNYEFGHRVVTKFYKGQRIPLYVLSVMLAFGFVISFYISVEGVNQIYASFDGRAKAITESGDQKADSLQASYTAQIASLQQKLDDLDALRPDRYKNTLTKSENAQYMAYQDQIKELRKEKQELVSKTDAATTAKALTHQSESGKSIWFLQMLVAGLIVAMLICDFGLGWYDFAVDKQGAMLESKVLIHYQNIKSIADTLAMNMLQQQFNIKGNQYSSPTLPEAQDWDADDLQLTEQLNAKKLRAQSTDN